MYVAMYRYISVCRL